MLPATRPAHRRTGWQIVASRWICQLVPIITCNVHHVTSPRPSRTLGSVPFPRNASAHEQQGLQRHYRLRCTSPGTTTDCATLDVPVLPLKTRAPTKQMRPIDRELRPGQHTWNLPGTTLVVLRSREERGAETSVCEPFSDERTFRWGDPVYAGAPFPALDVSAQKRAAGPSREPLARMHRDGPDKTDRS